MKIKDTRHKTHDLKLQEVDGGEMATGSWQKTERSRK